MKKIYLLILTAAISPQLFSQAADSAKKSTPLVITGSVDAYYRYNFNNPKNVPYNSFTSFTKSSNSFELGMASLRADHSFGKVSATVDLGFGTRAEEFAYNDANTKAAVKQLYLSYAPSAKIKFTLGTWATHVGYEMPDAYLNRNYSMSYMFTSGPFSHTGLKTDISLGGKSSLMLGIANPTDYRSAPAMPKSFIAQFATATSNDKLKAYFNIVAGKQTDYKKVVQGDIVVTCSVSEKFSIGFNGTLQSVKLDLDSSSNFTSYQWGGAALYLNYDPRKWFGITLRNEYIGDKDLFLGFDRIFAPTLSANFKIDNLTILPELRFDNSSRSIFYKDAMTSTKSTGSFVLAATYHF